MKIAVALSPGQTGPGNEKDEAGHRLDGVGHMTVSEQNIPSSYSDSIHGSFNFRCSCGYSDRGPWEESRYLMIRHVEDRHAGSQVKLDLDALEDLIEVLVSPSPLNSWEQLQSDSQV